MPDLPLFHPRRQLGRTGFTASVLGIGDIADRSVPMEQAVTTLHRAMDAGLNVIDTAPGYEDGYSEQIVGAALAGRREGMFVIDKIDHAKDPVLPQVESSLARLQLPAVDAFVFHGCSTMEGWKDLLLSDGPMDQLLRCREHGLCRFVGVSSHHPDVLQAAIESGFCDLLMFAIGPWCDRRYESEILPLARQRSIGTVCFKTFGAGKLLGDTSGYGRPLQARPRGKVSSGGKDSPTPLLPHLSVRHCVHYTLTVDPDVALLGMSFPNEQDAAFQAAGDFKPLSPEQMDDIRRQAAGAIRDKGPCWWNPA